MVKRLIKGHTQAKPAKKIEVAVFLPRQLFLKLHAGYRRAPDDVSFSAYIVALVEAGMEVAE